jgi:predicted membrane protein
MHLVSSGTSGLCNVLCPCHFRTTAFWLASVMLFLEANVVHVLNNTMLSLPTFDNCSYFVVFHFFRSSSNQLFETRFLNFIDHVIFFEIAFVLPTSVLCKIVTILLKILSSFVLWQIARNYSQSGAELVERRKRVSSGHQTWCRLETT